MKIPNNTQQSSNKINHLYYTIPACLIFVTVVFSLLADSISNKQAQGEIQRESSSEPNGVDQISHTHRHDGVYHSHNAEEHTHPHIHKHKNTHSHTGVYDSQTGFTIGIDNRELGGYRTALVKIDGIVFNLDIADTTQTRTLGLSNRESIAPQNGMLFFYENQAQHGIWMKDMNFAIDILWVNKDKTVVHTETNISPETFPTVFSSPVPSHYVIELPAGTWQEGSTISW